MSLDIGDRQPLDRLIASGAIKAYKETEHGVLLTFLDDTVIEIYAAGGDPGEPYLVIEDMGAAV